MEERDMLIPSNILSKENFDKICRCCLLSCSGGSIFEILHEETPLVNILYSVFGTQLDPNDDLPKKLCEACIGEIIRCHNFKKRFEAADATLRNIAIEIKDENSEIKLEPPEGSVEVEESQLNEEIITPLNENETSEIKEEDIEQTVSTMKPKQSNNFTCSCEETFASKLEFRQHRKVMKHLLPRDQPCNICGKFFPKYAIQKHIKSHEGVKRYHCDHCKRTFPSNRNLRVHMLTHTGEKPYVCELCGKRFTQQCSLKEHKRIHTGEKPYLCDLCGKSFSKKVSCTVHMRIHNSDKFSVLEPTKEVVCDGCGRVFHTQRACKRHLHQQCMGKGEVKDTDYQCKICKKYMSSRSNLWRHVKAHDQEKPFLCNECGKRFSSKHVLKFHSLVHSGEKSYVCEICDKKFTQQGQLQKHRHVHTGERPYACHLCPKKFSQGGSLTIHLKIHKGERPYVCMICDKRFARKDALNVHARVHTGEKPYKCDQCTNMFCDARTLRKHKERKHQT